MNGRAPHQWFTPSRWRLALAMPLLCQLVVACGPARLLEKPAGLPAELNGRRLWHTPRAYIYARDEAVAGETDRWVSDLNRHIAHTYNSQPGKGLVVVIDEKEEAFVDSFEEMVRLQRQTARAAGVEPHEMPLDDIQREKLRGAGMSEALACRITPFQLDEDALRSGGITEKLPEDLEWAISCPSHALMESAMWEFGPKSIEAKKGKAFAVATAWAWPLAFAEAAKGFRLGRDVLAFELWVIRQTDWPIEKRKSEIAKYTEARAFVISPTLALALKLARGDEHPHAAPPETDAPPATTAPADAPPADR